MSDWNSAQFIQKTTRERPLRQVMPPKNPKPTTLRIGNGPAGIVREELDKAGWRLADLLEKCVKSNGTESTSKVSNWKQDQLAPPRPNLPQPLSSQRPRQPSSFTIR